MSRSSSIQLSDHFDCKRLLSFTLAPISAMFFTSLYSIVDGFFVSNYVGAAAFASLNLTMPYIMMIASVGFMFGSGGSALVSMYLGLGEKQKAKESFSLIVYVLIAVGTGLALLSEWLTPDISRILGASDSMMPYCVLYLRITMLGIVFFMLQNLFQAFLITAEKPKLGFIITLIAGCSNMIFDWLLVGVFHLGIAGAAWATVISQVLGGGIPFLYFLCPNSSRLRLASARWDFGVIIKSCGNGISEFLSNVSSSIIGFLYNLQLLHYAGEDGVSAYGVIMYVSFVFVAIYIGYSMGVAPIIGFHFGADNKKELQNVFKKSVVILGVTNVIMTVGSQIFADLLVRLFVGYDPKLYELTVTGMRIYSVAFLIMGYNIFASSFFTALNNGIVSAIISVSRTLVLEIIMIYFLPALFGVTGLWSVVIAVEGLGGIISLFFVLRNRRRYGY
ncbi:MAG: MATE family efflux transporter [Clostridiaceae bacterium]|nr:MATE family efflux transporter [Clostridiaceae bacterium]